MRKGNIDYQMMGLRIQRMRREMDLTQQELAERVGVSVSYIGHIERGLKSGSLDAIAAICRALDTSADFLLFGHDFNKDRLAIVHAYLEQHLEFLRDQISASDPLSAVAQTRVERK